MNTKEQWDTEYKSLNSIPSSWRIEPAHGLVKMKELGVIPSRLDGVLDLGCGNGRNAFYLSKFSKKVECLDYSKETLKLFREKLAQIDADNIDLTEADILNGIPFVDDSFDLVLDSYVHCHFTKLDEWDFVLNEASRVIKKGGSLISIQLSVDDHYYHSKRKRDFDGGFVSFDESNGIEKIHFKKDRYSQLLTKKGFVVSAYEIGFSDIVSNSLFDRKVIVFCGVKK
jgi:SAM-dependent methyltransferase